MSNKKKFVIQFPLNDAPVHLQGLTMWGSDVPRCHVCKRSDKVIWDSGEYKCSRCHVVVENR